MKKSRLFISSLLMVNSLILTSCDFLSFLKTNKDEQSQKEEQKPEQIEPEEHVHTFSSEWTINETHHYHESTCEHKGLFSDYAEHEFDEYVIDKEATYDEEGLRHRDCKICGYSEVETIEKIKDPDENALDLPIFYIDTENSAPIVSKEDYVNATMKITNARDYNDEGLTLGIRGRGNYSWSGTEKKSYRIKFDSKYQPLGQGKGKAKSWTLLAVHCDKSLLRTDAAFHFASKLSNIPFVSSSGFVELYLNGQYDGVYQLCDQIQVNKYRVDIDDTGEEEDIGYLAELDKNASEDVITLNNGLTFELKSDYVNDNQINFITNYLNQCQTAISNGNKEGIEQLIDISSAVDCYLVEELFKNLDVGWGSFYYTKPKGDKLYFGPVWDFDLTAGNADSDTYDTKFTSYKYTYVGNSYFKNYMQQHSWYISLRKQAWFNELIAERWNEIKEYADETVTYIENMANKYHASFERNFVRWDIFDQKINREPSAILKIKTFDGQVEYFKDWLANRIDWLDSFYKGEVADIK